MNVIVDSGVYIIGQTGAVRPWGRQTGYCWSDRSGLTIQSWSDRSGLRSVSKEIIELLFRFMIGQTGAVRPWGRQTEGRQTVGPSDLGLTQTLTVFHHLLISVDTSSCQEKSNDNDALQKSGKGISAL